MLTDTAPPGDEMDVARLLSGLHGAAPPAKRARTEPASDALQQQAGAYGMEPPQPNMYALMQYYQLMSQGYMGYPQGMYPQYAMPNQILQHQQMPPTQQQYQQYQPIPAQPQPYPRPDMLSEPRVGAYNAQDRRVLLEKFHAKRLRRLDTGGKKTIRYGIRKNLADSRLRIKGRFVKRLPGSDMPAELGAGEEPASDSAVEIVSTDSAPSSASSSDAEESFSDGSV